MIYHFRQVHQRRHTTVDVIRSEIVLLAEMMIANGVITRLKGIVNARTINWLRVGGAPLVHRILSLKRLRPYVMPFLGRAIIACRIAASSSNFR